MTPLSYRLPCLLALCSLLAGCGEKGVDSHPEVFKTADQVTDDRRAKLLDAHKALAISVLKFSRPDLTAKPGAGGVIELSADGFTQPIDLMSIEEEMNAHADRERAILRKYLDEQLRPFDLKRIRELGLDKLKGDLRYELVNSAGVEGFQALTGPSKVHARTLAAGLFCVTTVRRPGTVMAVNDDLLATWHAAPEAVDAAAAETMRRLLTDAGDEAIETTSYSTVGRTGRVRIDAGVVVLPEFLDAVHKAWGTDDDLVISLPSTRAVQFMERHDERLMALVLPQWRSLVATSPDPLSRSLLLMRKGGLEIFTPPPTSQPAPAATAPATKPAPYIVH